MSVRSFSQQTTYSIVYTFDQLTGCNVFASPVNISATATTGSTVTSLTLPHQTSIGWPSFLTTFNNAKTGAIILPCGLVSPSLLECGVTEYSIQFPFKKNYNYAISVYGAVANTGGDDDPQIGLFLSSTPDGTNTATTCGALPLTSDSHFQNYSQQGTATSFTWANNIINGPVTADNVNYLLVAGIPTGNDYSTYSIYVNTIQIVEMPAFSLTPASVGVSCVAGATKTFSIVNNVGASNITGYTWNIGAGWSYNGTTTVTGPATITTSAPSISLTTSGGTTLPGDVTATVNYGSPATTFTTNAAVAVGAAPTAADFQISSSITGSLCSTGTYSINVPSGANINWSATPSGVVSIGSPTAASTTLTQLTSGSVQLSATVTDACGTSGSISVPASTVNVGAPVFSGTYENACTNTYESLATYPGGTNTSCASCKLTAITTSPNGSTTAWSLVSYTGGLSPTSTIGTSPNTLSFIPPAVNGTYLFQATATNGCGTTTQEYNFKGTNCCTTPAFETYPNPASQSVNIVSTSPICPSAMSEAPTVEASTKAAGTVSHSTEAGATIKEIKIYDASGRLQRDAAYPSATQQVQLDVSGLANGIYFVKITTTNNKTQTTKLVVQH